MAVHSDSWIILKMLTRASKVICVSIIIFFILFTLKRRHSQVHEDKEIETAYDFFSPASLFSDSTNSSNAVNSSERHGSGVEPEMETIDVQSGEPEISAESLTTLAPKELPNEMVVKDDDILHEATRVKKENYMITCKNLPRIKLKYSLGTGVTKQAYLGEYKGIDVVVKVARNRQYSTCTGNIDVSQPTFLQNNCFGHPNKEIMKEIFILDKLNHPNLANLLGFCIHGYLTHGINSTFYYVIAIEEFGRKISEKTLNVTGWKDRLRHAQEMADLLYYFENSPLGAIIQTTYVRRHFVLKDNHIKMIDMDSIFAEDSNCRAGGKCARYLQCKVYNHKCRDYDRTFHMKGMHDCFSKILFDPVYYPPSIQPQMAKIAERIQNATIRSDELIKELKMLRTMG